MNGMEMPSKVKTNKIILQVLGWLTIVIGIIMGIVFFVIGLGAGASGDEGAAVGAAIGAGMGIVILIFAVIFGILYLITAKGIANKKNWAKIVGIILAVLSLFNFPIGTALGIWMLINFFSDEGKAWFEETVRQSSASAPPVA